MKFSEHWLREWVNPPLSTSALAEQLTMAGLEVDIIEPVASTFDQVVIGEVLAVEPHSHAQKLKVCQVNVGEGTPLTIVCGAPHVAVGMRVPTARIGAQLSDLILQATELRGVVSQGMLCSVVELGLADSATGLLVLPPDAPIGEAVRHYLNLDDVSITVDLTPNRGDCLSIVGIAREISALTHCPMTAAEVTAVTATITDTWPVTLQADALCPRYVGRVIKNVNAQAPTPLWLQERLRRSGLRSISALVDITNYVLLEYGQPMHAFDLDKLSGGIQVRLAQAGESLTLLDEQTVSLGAQTLVIADHQSPVAIAGVMGGKASAVTATTRTVFLESAYFAVDAIGQCARHYGLQTDSSYRFERGVDPQQQRRAIERATALVLTICGGEAGPVNEVVAATYLPSCPTITVRTARIQRLLGQTLAEQEVEALLTRLGLDITARTQAGWQVVPPSFRFDLTIEADIIEELARVYGYNRLPSRAPNTRLTLQSQPHLSLRQLQAILVQRDYQEVITYSFVDPHWQAELMPEVSPLRLLNPIASDMAVMRTTLWIGLLKVLQYNQKRQQHRLRLFETGLRFLPLEKGMLQQEGVIAGVVAGHYLAEQWDIATRPTDFFDVKADVEALLQSSGQKNYHFSITKHPALHPGQAALITQNKQTIGVIGALHPRLTKLWALTPPVYVFELLLAPLFSAHLPKFKEISKYPSMRRDLALIVDESVSAATLLKYVKEQASTLLVDLQLFDVYQGKGIAPGKKSLAIGLIFQAFSRNLTESEVDTVMTQLLNSLENNLSAQIRK